ncbi:MAG: MFS transporter [Acidimicrobiales bacterium]
MAAPSPTSPTALRVTVAASATLTVGVIPVFLVGALSSDMGADLGFGSAGTGFAITVFFAAGGLTAVMMGRVTERIGARAAMRSGVAISGVCTLALGTVVGSLWQLAVVLGVAGTAIGLIDTGGARSFADAIRSERHGLAFGAKEASVPAASMLAGVSLPLLASTLGWEWVFVVGAALAPVVWCLVPAGRALDPTVAPAPAVDGSPDRSRRRLLVVFSVGVAFGAAASSASATLFVPAVTDAGWSSASAGLLLAAASVVSIATRLVLGWSGDAIPDRTWQLLAGSLALGASGLACLALADSGLLVPVGAIMALGAGWGWSGLAFLSAVRASPEAPAVAAGIVLTGLATGGAVGPAAFGVLADQWSYQVSWTAAALALVVAAVLAVVSRRAHAPVLPAALVAPTPEPPA